MIIGRLLEVAAVLPLHAPEQLRPVRLKRRVAAAVVLEVDAVDGRQQVAPASSRCEYYPERE